MTLAYRLLRRGLFALDPERAHELALGALRRRLVPDSRVETDLRLERTFLGLDFPNPIGLAAGFDKNGEAIDGLFRLGLGFVEVGTVTPRAQEGNPRPRLFRLPTSNALINRMGFNNQGHEALYRRLVERRTGQDLSASTSVQTVTAPTVWLTTSPVSHDSPILPTIWPLTCLRPTPQGSGICRKKPRLPTFSNDWCGHATLQRDGHRFC